MEKKIFEIAAIRLGESKKLKGVLLLETDKISFSSDHDRDNFSILIPDLRNTEVVTGVEKSLFSKKHYVDIQLENNELRFQLSEADINNIVSIYNQKKIEFTNEKYQEELAVRISVFSAYVKRKIESIEKKECYSGSVLRIIDTTIDSIKSVQYDDVLSVEENKAKIDTLVADLKKSIEVQLNKERIEEGRKLFQTKKKELIEESKLKYRDEVGRVLNIVLDGVKKLEGLLFNESMSNDDNINVLVQTAEDTSLAIDALKEKENEELSKYRSEPNDPNKYSDLVKKSSRTIYELILDNPYFVLGLPITASYSDALGVKDKIEKFAKLKVSKAFVSPYDLKNIENPKRDMSAIQSATVRAKETKYKWIWFQSSEYAKIWEADLLFDWLEEREFNFDIFNAVYIHLIFKDPTFTDARKWKLFLEKLDFIFSLDDAEMWEILKKQVRVTEEQPNEKLLKEFRDTIIIPFDQLLRTANETVVNSYTKNVAPCKVKNNVLKELIQDALVDKSSDKLSATQKAIKDYDYDVSIYDLDDTFKETISLVHAIGVCVKKVGSATSTYVKRNDDIYAKLLKDITVFFLDQDEKDMGEHYAKKLYKLSNSEDQRKLRNSFGYETFGLHYSDLDAEEMRAIGIRYHEGNGVRKDEYQSYVWLKRAADAGDDASALLVGMQLVAGENISRDIKLGKKYLQQAADAGNIEALKLLLKLHMPHEHYDLGYIHIPYNERKLVEVAVNFIAYVRLLDDYNYNLYVDRGEYSFYGGRQTQSPCRIGIPESGHWHLVVDNDGEEMGNIKSSECYTRTIPRF